IFEQTDTRPHQHTLQFRRLPHELEVVGRRAEAHDAFDTGTIVPGAVEQDHLATGGEMLDITLEIPLRGLALRRLFQRDDACSARIEVLHEALDRATLAR